MNQSKSSRPKNVKYGWKPDLPDFRDKMYGAVYKIPAALPSAVDLRTQNICPPVVNQGELGSCTANALTGALEILELKAKKTLIMFSRLFVYFNERVIEHDVNEDKGAQIRDGIKTLAKLGACSEDEWPYDIAKFKVKPPDACYTDALNHQIISYHRLETVDQMRACLASGFPFVFGFTVYSSFESEQVAQTGILNMPQLDENILGGHAVVAIGYDDTSKRFIIRNSRGADWGMKGCFTMPYDYLANRKLSDDIWEISQIEGT
jgi:C1A family cysteine protease